MIQMSKRGRAITRQQVGYSKKLTGKTYAHQQAHREKLYGTVEGLIEQAKREQRRPNDQRRRHKRQNLNWNWSR